MYREKKAVCRHLLLTMRYGTLGYLKYASWTNESKISSLRSRELIGIGRLKFGFGTISRVFRQLHHKRICWVVINIKYSRPLLLNLPSFMLFRTVLSRHRTASYIFKTLYMWWNASANPVIWRVVSTCSEDDPGRHFYLANGYPDWRFLIYSIHFPQYSRLPWRWRYYIRLLNVVDFICQKSQVLRHCYKYTMMYQWNTIKLYYACYCKKATCFDSYRIIFRSI